MKTTITYGNGEEIKLTKTEREEVREEVRREMDRQFYERTCPDWLKTDEHADAAQWHDMINAS